MKYHTIGIWEFSATIFSRKHKRYNPLDPRDAEELLNYLQQLSSDDEEYEQVKSCDHIDLVLLPSQDGRDSDIDDASSDNDEMCDIHDIGKGVLRQPMEIVTVKDHQKEKHHLQLDTRSNLTSSAADSSSDNIPLAKRFKTAPEKVKEKDPGSKVISSENDSSSDSDDIPLAKRFKAVPKANKPKRVVKKTRQWIETTLQFRPDKTKIQKTPEPAIVQKIRDENLSPVDLFKIFFPEEFIQTLCSESQKYAIFQGKHDFSVSSAEMYIYLQYLSRSRVSPSM